MTPTAFVQQRLTALLETPDGWGPPHAVELQILLLLEMWHVTQGATQQHVDALTERYNRHLFVQGYRATLG